MIIQTLCDQCARWVDPREIDLCVDCHTNLCPACATATSHRREHQEAAEWEREERPQGWDYLRCKDTPYDINAD